MKVAGIQRENRPHSLPKIAKVIEFTEKISNRIQSAHKSIESIAIGSCNDLAEKRKLSNETIKTNGPSLLWSSHLGFAINSPRMDKSPISQKGVKGKTLLPKIS